LRGLRRSSSTIALEGDRGTGGITLAPLPPFALREYRSRSLKYRVYGLLIESDCALPELDGPAPGSSRSVPDVSVRLRFAPAAVPRDLETVFTRELPDGTPWLRCARLEDGFVLSFARAGAFHINRAGRRVSCVRRERGVPLAMLRHLLLDQVLPFLLNLRGCEAIHATAIAAAPGACAFIGPSGAGKSTLAASFLLAGCASIADDCLVLESSAAEVAAVPAYPGLRLWSDTASALALTCSDSTAIYGRARKRRMLAPRSRALMPRRPLPLRRIYRLVRADGCGPHAPEVEPVSPRDAFMELISASFPLDFRDQRMLARHFRAMQCVAGAVPMRRLIVPDDLSALDAVRGAVLADLGRT
jgi:hypothetical protein